jgi:prepilin-type N-terminal cleavage/methylation domain-containing protein
MKIFYRNSGFTIIELMVAMAVMAFGILGFIFMQSRAAQGRLAGREMSRATVVAQNVSEILRSLDSGDPMIRDEGNHPTATDGGDTDGTLDNKLSTKYGNFTYNTTWTVSKNTNNLKTINISTSWRLKDNQTGMKTKILTFTLLRK